MVGIGVLVGVIGLMIRTWDFNGIPIDMDVNIIAISANES
jgi:hypothetical protein